MPALVAAAAARVAEAVGGAGFVALRTRLRSSAETCGSSTARSRPV